MATRFQSPPHFRDVFVELADGTRQVDQGWHDWFLDLASALSTGVSATVPLAKITGGGTDGSLTIVNGIVTAVTQPT